MTKFKLRASKTLTRSLAAKMRRTWLTSPLIWQRVSTLTNWCLKLPQSNASRLHLFSQPNLTWATPNNNSTFFHRQPLEWKLTHSIKKMIMTMIRATTFMRQTTWHVNFLLQRLLRQATIFMSMTLPIINHALIYSLFYMKTPTSMACWCHRTLTCW